LINKISIALDYVIADIGGIVSDVSFWHVLFWVIFLGVVSLIISLCGYALDICDRKIRENRFR
jgi:hypothetical protein